MPTLKQKIAFKKISENIREKGKKPLNIGSILRAAGYSDSVCKSPQRVTQTKGWTELMEEYFPDDLVLSKHKALINSDNTRIVASALDMAYKVKGYYKSVKQVQHTDTYEQMTDDELFREILRLRSELHILPQGGGCAVCGK